MFLAPGIRGQTSLDDILDFSGSIASGGTAQLALVQQLRRASLLICNTSSDTLTVGIGPPRPIATLSSGTVSSISVSSNAGIGYTKLPQVRILGGLVDGDYANAPSNVATAHASGLSGSGGISSIVVDNPGSGYNVAPLIYLENPITGGLGGGAFLPSASAGIPLPPGWSLNWGGAIVVPTSAIAIYGATTADAYTIKVGGLV